jgi:hypothetical protein
MLYPRVWGYEGWLVYRARILGLAAAQLKGVKSYTLRPTRSKGFGDGMAMKALGYPLLYAIGRSAKVGLRSPVSGVGMMAGFLEGRRGDREVANWVRAEKVYSMGRLALSAAKLVAST